jgi:hypothetical protein
MFEQGRVISLIVDLINFDNSRRVDISNLVNGINIIEDVFKNTLYGTISILDGVNLLSGIRDKTKNFPIVGEEFVEIKYVIDWHPEPVTISLRFLVFGITDIQHERNSTSKRYVLRICSEEHLIDSTTMVSKGYTGKNSDSVKSLLEDYLFLGNGKKNQPYEGRKEKQIVYIEPTRGEQNICIPYFPPLKATDFLAKRSISESETFSSGSYLFFENFKGFNFCSTEYLIQQGTKKAIEGKKKSIEHNNFLENFEYFFENPLISAHEYRNQKTIIRMTQKNMFDTIEKLRYGMYESHMLVYDYINKRNVSTSFNFLNSGLNKGQQKTNNSFLALGNENEESYPENSITFIRTLTSGDNKPQYYNKYFYIPKDLSINDTYLDQIYKNRNAFFTRLNQNMFTVETTGNPNLNAGDVIFVNVPSGDGATLSESRTNKFLTGYYLVCTISHTITKTGYFTKMDIYKNGYGVPVQSTKESLEIEIVPENNSQKNLDAAVELAGFKNYLPGEEIDVSPFYDKLKRKPGT